MSSSVVVILLAAGVLVWTLAGVVVAVLIGQVIRRADRLTDELTRTRRAVVAQTSTGDIPAVPTHPRGPGTHRAEPAPTAASPR